MTAEKYADFHSLISSEPDGYRIEWWARISHVLIHTPHGGGIEPGVSELVRAMAGDDYSWYCFEGTRRAGPHSAGNDALHITSTRFDEPISTGLVQAAQVVLAVHGCRSRRRIIFVGGLHEEWIRRFIMGFRVAGFAAERGQYNISGTSPRNLCNRGKPRRGVQIELTEGLRQELFAGLDRVGRQHPTALFDRFVQTGRRILKEINSDLTEDP